jgi:ribose transport system permease protein
MSATSGGRSPFRHARRGLGVGLTSLRDYGIVASFVVIVIVLTFKSDVFLTKVNLFNVLDQNASDGIMACGGTLVLIAGGFDLSVGAIFAMSGVIAAQSAAHMSPTYALILGALAGLGVGILNGFITTVGRINPIVGTLASSIIIQGVALVLTNGLLVNVTRPGFTSLGQGTVFTLHYSVIVWAIFAIISGFLLWRTKFGRYIFASGGNAEAARLSGVRVSLIRGTTYAISGLSAGIAGVIVASRVATGEADTGTFPLTVIAGIVIGGTSILGGEGAIWRSVLGILLLALIGNGFNLLGVNPIYQQILQGSIILTAVAVDAWARKTSN